MGGGGGVKPNCKAKEAPQVDLEFQTYTTVDLEFHLDWRQSLEEISLDPVSLPHWNTSTAQKLR
jgi:hypothetical protein